MKVVQAYLNGEGSYEYLGKKYNLSDKHPLRIWVSSYKEFGKEGLKEKLGWMSPVQYRLNTLAA